MLAARAHRLTDLVSCHAVRLFGHSGACSACGLSIPASEMVMRAQGSVYHLKVSLLPFQQEGGDREPGFFFFFLISLD